MWWTFKSAQYTFQQFQVMGSKKAAKVAKQIEDMRRGGHGSYYGESVEVLAALQLQHS